MILTNIKDGKYTCYIQRGLPSYAFPTLVYSTLCLEVVVADVLRHYGCEVVKTSEYADMCVQYQNAGVDLLVKMGAAEYRVDVKRCFGENMANNVPVSHIKECGCDLIATVMDGMVYLAKPDHLLLYARPDNYGKNSVAGADFAKASSMLGDCGIFPMPLSKTDLALLKIGVHHIFSKLNITKYKKYDPATQYDAIDQMLSDVIFRSEFAIKFKDMLGVEPDIMAI